MSTSLPEGRHQFQTWYVQPLEPPSAFYVRQRSEVTAVAMQ